MLRLVLGTVSRAAFRRQSELPDSPEMSENKANSELKGDITTKSLKMEEGALLSGKMQTGA